MKNAFLSFLLLLFSFFLGLGLYKLFGTPAPGEDVTAYFSVAGLFLVSAGLLYQIKEYQAQVVELKNSVAAQNKTATALDHQKELLIEQARSQQIFSMINSFRQFADRLETMNAVHSFTKNFGARFSTGLINLYQSRSTHTTPEFTSQYAQLVVDILKRDIKSDHNFPVTRKFVQNVYNILYMIHKTDTGKKDWFTPFFLNNLSPDETLTAYLICLISDYGVPITGRLEWYYQLTEEFIKRVSDSKVPASLLDSKQLTTEFNALRPLKD